MVHLMFLAGGSAAAFLGFKLFEDVSENERKLSSRRRVPTAKTLSKPNEAKTSIPAGARFYEAWKPFPDEPTRQHFNIIDDETMGQGLIALVPFQPGDTVFKFTGKILSEQTLYTLQEAPGRYVEDPMVMGKILHSCDPNMECDMTTRTFRARKPISPNDYLTMDYESTEDELFRSFQCRCGAPDCRGLIRGKKFRNTNLTA